MKENIWLRKRLCLGRHAGGEWLLLPHDHPTLDSAKLMGPQNLGVAIWHGRLCEDRKKTLWYVM